MKARIFVEGFGRPAGSLSAYPQMHFVEDLTVDGWPDSAIGAGEGLRNFPDAGTEPLYARREHITYLKWTAWPE